MQIAGSRAWPHGSGGPAIALVEWMRRRLDRGMQQDMAAVDQWLVAERAGAMPKRKENEDT